MDGSNKSKEAQEKINRGTESKGKSCKGYLYYSTTLKSKNLNPRCIGIPKTLQQVPRIAVGKSEAEATRDGRILKDFYYSCLGYSIYTTGNDGSSDKRAAKNTLPACLGLELIANRKEASTRTVPAPAPAPAHIHSREEVREVPVPQPPRPPSPSVENQFLSRFTRNASVVASGVMKNMQRVGHYVKETVNDMLYPYRRRPK